MSKKIVIAIFLALTSTFGLLGQDKLGKPGETYDELINQIELYQGSDKVWVYLKAYLSKAKNEENYTELSLAYKEMLHECDEKYRVAYADSMVSAAKMSKDADIIGSAHLTKGIMFYNEKKLNHALDNYLIANKFLATSNDEYLRHKVKFHIGHIKYYLGYYNEALSLFTDCVEFYREEGRLPYLTALHSLGLCYNKLGNIKKSSEINMFALSESTRLKRTDLLSYIEHSEGVNNYYRGEYKQAIDRLNYSLLQIIDRKDFANESVAYFYIGKSNLGLKDTTAAINYFKKVDAIFKEHIYFKPDLRESYEFLIRYYKNRKKPLQQLQYIDQLLKADSLLNTQYKYLSKKVHRDFDTKELLDQKDKINQELNRKMQHNTIFKFIISVLAILVIYFAYRHINTRRLYKRRFDQLMKKEQTISVGKVISTDVSAEVVKNILEKMELFENNLGFLKKDLNAGKLAESFGTNYKYLSKVIHLHRQKNFVAYINDLRIDYIVDKLKQESKLRRYTNSALADEAGFSTTQHFTSAFKKKTGISPGYFIQKLEKLGK